METNMKRICLVFLVAVFTLVALFAGNSIAEMEKPFGTKKDIKYSKKLWKSLEKAHLVGPNAIHSVPYDGQAPHGIVLESLSSVVSVSHHKGEVHVKANYGGPDITRSKVVNNPEKYLKAVTVMFKRKKGYDSDNQDWFWVKYTPDGNLHKNPMGIPLAGRVAKGMEKGCIACHSGADGGDFLFNNTALQLD